ncbi:hypothetical protein LJC40_01495 [Synergistaceae bacterium OttesenSCG-928-D05]|nr:hypothetical protein [Synergistaceae bacterium OttesenSCG-928-D05]
MSRLSNGNKPTLAEAKANFAASVDGIDPLRTAKERPLLTLGATVAVGIFMGYAGLRLLRKTIFHPSIAYEIVRRLL